MVATPENDQERKLLDDLAIARDRYRAAVDADQKAGIFHTQLGVTHPDRSGVGSAPHSLLRFWAG